MADKININKFYGLSFLSFTALTLCIVSLISDSNKTADVTRLTWGLGEQVSGTCEGGCMKVYVGVWQVLLKLGDFTYSLDYSGNACTESYCDKCTATMKYVIGFVALALVFTLPSIITNFLRATDAGNNVTNKYVGVATSFFCLCCAIISIVGFSVGCFAHIRDDAALEYHWNYGPSWILMVIVAALKAIDVWANLFTADISA